MALNGVSPLFIFTLLPEDPNAAKDALSGLPPAVASTLTGIVGIPIPIYLEENITKILLDGDDRNLNFETMQAQDQTGKNAKTFQRGIQNDVSINMRADNTSLILTAILALVEQCFALAVGRKYSISYFSGTTVIIGGLINGFNTSQDPNKTETHITMTITKKPLDVGLTNFPTLSKSTGAIPVFQGGN